MAITKPQVTEPTPSGFRFRYVHTGQWMAVTVQQRKIQFQPIKKDEPPNAPPPELKVDWQLLSELIIYFPTSLPEAERVLKHWCSLYDSELRDLVGAVLEQFTKLPEAVYDEPVPEPVRSSGNGQPN